MAFWTPGTLTVNGLTLHTYRAGEGRPLLLVHGMTDDGRYWTPVARELAGSYAVVTFDMRGHGRSEKPSSGYRVADYAADLAAIIPALGLERPAVLGHSLGAATTALAAAAHPDRFGCVLLEDPPFFAPPPGSQTDEGRAGIVAWRDGLALLKQAPRAAREAQGRSEHPTWTDEAIALWADAKEQVTLDIFAPWLEWREDWRDPMRKLTCPTLLITGDGPLGGMVLPGVAAEIQSLNPRVEVAHIPGAGHSIRFDRQDAYLAAVRDFLGRHDT